MARYPETLSDMPPPRRPRRFWRFVRRHLSAISLSLMVALFMAVLLFPYIVITVPSGEVGVLWKRFNGYDIYCWCFVGRGTILDPQELRDEGLHLVWPWDKLYQYNLRLQSATQTYNAITKDGVNVTVQINIRFQLLHNSVGVLHKFIGPDYLNSVITPEIGSQAREVISQYTAQEVYTSREAIQDKVRETSQKSLGAHLNALVQPEAMEQPDPKHYNDFLQNSVQILDTLVLSIELPPEIVAAINRQTQQFYEIQEYKFRVQREAEESRRKQIEANGIAAFQRTVSQGISDSYLRWRGIEATLALAQSPNSKIVIIGGGKDGLPIILGNVDSPAAPQLKLPTIPGLPAKPSPTSSSNFPQPQPPASAEGAAAGSEVNSAVATGSKPGDTAKQPGTPGSPAQTTPETPVAKPESSSNGVGLSDLESILSRISDKIRSTVSSSPSSTGQAPPK